MDSNPEVEFHIGRNIPWTRLPTKIREIFGNAQKGYEKAVLAYSIRNQLRFSDHLRLSCLKRCFSLMRRVLSKKTPFRAGESWVEKQTTITSHEVKTVQKDEGRYYEDVVNYSKDHLMLYPYHLSDRVVKGLRITPFQYYSSVMEMIMDQEKSYDSLPNFTAADCLRLLGIGRNQYIELMNKYRASRKLFRRKPPRELLPSKPIDISVDPWFKVHVGYVTEEDIALTKPNERKIIDFLIDNGGQRAGTLDFDCVHSLYRKGLIYLDVPIASDDYIVVPPLEGFVMNRVLGDYFETLLYKIFVSIDEHTTVGELSSVLDIDAQLIKNAVSLYCRLGFAYKKNVDSELTNMDPSWQKYQPKSRNSNTYVAQDENSITNELTSALAESDSYSSDLSMQLRAESCQHAAVHSFLSGGHSTSSSNPSRRIAFLYDSTLTAFLMMGNLSPGLKNHAVTMFEVGKMPDESLDSFLSELENISWTEGEGEAQRYFEHAKTLRKAILFLRNNSKMGSMSLDLLRCESLLNLDKLTCSRLLNKNYELIVSMAPLSYEVTPVCSENLPHFGPSIPQVNSVWFKLFLYSITNSGPTSLLMTRGSVLHELPFELEDCDKYLVTSWGHDSSVIPGANALFTLNDALTHSAVFVQAYGLIGESSTVIVPFPLTWTKNQTNESDDAKTPSQPYQMYAKWAKHPAIVKLSRLFDLERSCGFITMMNIRGNADSSITKNEANVAMPDNKSPGVLPRSSTLSNVTEEETNEDPSEELVMAENEDGHVVISGNTAKPEPRNGFKDDQSAKIYQEELESELTAELSVKPKGFDSRQQKIESLRLDLTDLSLNDSGQSRGSSDANVSDPLINPDASQSEPANQEFFWYDDWTLLDCQFGLPLFDSGVNEIVCDQLVSKGLWEEKSLEQLVKFNAELGRQLMNFINAHQAPAPDPWKEEIPLPSKNFYCHNGRLLEIDPFDL